MKKTTLAITLGSIITLSTGAHALDLYVVSDYDKASDASLWVMSKPDQVPEALLSTQQTNAPGAAYSALFPKSFLQEKMFAVCYQRCDQSEIFKVSGGEINPDNRKSWDVVEQSNVYFWLRKYFHFLETEINFTPKMFLKVFTNRDTRDFADGKQLKNNAFFNKEDTTLNFLPASTNLLFKLLNGKINRSGFDPSVIAHETSHFLFQHLFPNPVNDEINGLNEGFADYMANIFLNNPKIGVVMLQGKALRDASSLLDSEKEEPKVYKPRLEVHKLGERVAYALWKTRELLTEKEEFDRLVIDAVSDLSQNPYSTAHDFKVKMLERTAHLADSSTLSTVTAIWDLTFPGTPKKLETTAVLNYDPNTQTYVSFDLSSEDQAQGTQTAKSVSSKLEVLQLVKVSETIEAIYISDEANTSPYWVVVDYERSNILGIYDSEKNLVVKDFEKVIRLASKAVTALNLIKEFKGKLSLFADLEKEKGQLSISYKVRNRSITPATLTFNGTQIPGQRVHFVLKRKLLGGVLLGMPNLNSIDLYTAPILKGALPESNGQTVFGYRINFESGATQEVILSKMPL